MKKHFPLILPLLLVVVSTSILLPIYRAHADINSDAQQSTTYAQQAQAAAQQAAIAAAAAQQCGSQTHCAALQEQAAVADAQTAATAGTNATLLAQQDQSSASTNSQLVTQIYQNATEADNATVAAANSAAQAGTAYGDQTVVQQETAIAQKYTTAAQQITQGGQQATGVPVTAPVAAASPTAGSNFVPLTALPGVSTVAGSTNFIALFNNLYKVAIGIAAALAFLEIVWAGVTWMTAGDSAEKVGQARTRIGNAVLGLLLVLSPVIVFGIINPNVLSLNLNVSALTPTTTGGAGAAAGAGAGSTAAGALNPNAAPGTPGAACTTNKDCDGDNTVCNDATGACAADGPGVFSCTDDSATNAQGLCANGQPPKNVNRDEAPADGSVTSGASCAGNEDACQNGYTCNDQNFTCTAIPQDGAAESGQSCAGNVNACDNGLTCDDDSDTCVAATADDNGGDSQQTVTCPDGTQVDNASDCADGSDGNDDSGN